MYRGLVWWGLPLKARLRVLRQAYGVLWDRAGVGAETGVKLGTKMGTRVRAEIGATCKVGAKVGATVRVKVMLGL